MKKDLVVYQTEKGALELNTDATNDTIWATGMKMADIFDVNPQATTKHIQNIYKEGELEKDSTSSKMEPVQIEKNRQVKRNLDFYNLEMIISVGYRINPIKFTKFRQWAYLRLKDYLSKHKLAS